MAAAVAGNLLQSRDWAAKLAWPLQAPVRGGKPIQAAELCLTKV